MALRDLYVRFRAHVDQRGLVTAQTNVERLITRFNGLRRIAQFALGAIGVGAGTRLADDYFQLENRLRAVTEGTHEFNEAQSGVERIAKQLKVPLTDVAEGYLRYKLATEQLGRSQEEVLDFTKRTTQAMLLSGASTEEAHRAAVQLAQGFGKNFRAAAQDLKSVKEQAPILAKIIEKAAGVLPGQLLVAAKEGKISAQLVFDAVRAEGANLDREFEQRNLLFGNIFARLQNAALMLIKRLKEPIGGVIKLFDRVADSLDAWVADGSAVNQVVAALVVVVGALTYAFGSLVLSMWPALLAFAAIEDFVAFIRGDHSIIEEVLDKLFGDARTEKFRAALREIVELFGKIFTSVGGAESELAIWRFQRKFIELMKKAWEVVADYSMLKLREAMGDTLADAWGIRKPGEAERDRAMDQVMSHRQHSLDRELPAPTWAPVGEEPLPQPVFRYNRLPEAAQEHGQDPWMRQSHPWVRDDAPVINNNITVEGNADAQTAREISSKAAEATLRSMNVYVRGDVGANFGIDR